MSSNEKSLDYNSARTMLPSKDAWISLMLDFVVIGHFVLVFGNMLACLVLPFYVSWYISLPLITFLVQQFTSRVECPLTRLENSLRRKLGRPEIKTFLKHYFIEPLRWKSE
jgi:hypothetical protein